MIQIMRGDVGRPVRILQYLLGLTPTGTFDSVVEDAVRKFQTAAGIKVDGVVGPITWGKIAEARHELRINTWNNAVKVVQEILGATVDGKFGPKTEAAVKAAQGLAGLPQTGIVTLATWKYLLTEHKVSTDIRAVQPVDFKQYDPRWRNKMYSSHGDKRQTMSNSGCGPTAMADVCATFWNPNSTPETLADLAMRNKLLTSTGATLHRFFSFCAKYFKASRYLETRDTNVVKKALQAGALVIANMGPGYWTGGGHFITCWKYDPSNNLIYANDPASPVRKSASGSSFARERKKYFIFYK